MMTTIGTIAVGLIVLYLLVRFAFQQQFFDLLVGLIRRLCGLRLRSVDAGGLTWHYLEGGNPNAEPLVLVHGFGGDKDNWPIYARYFKHSHRVIIPDLPGFGDSDRDMDGDYTVAAQTRRLHEFTRALGIDKLHIAGNSMGGAVALDYALNYPESVITLTLLCSAGVNGDTKSELEIRAERGESPLVVSTMKEFEWLIRFIVHRPIPLPGVVKRVLFDRALERRAFLDRVFWSLFDEVRKRPFNDQLPRLAVPTLIVWGRHDRLIDVSCTEVLAARIPENRLVVFEDAGHIPMIERPAATAAAHRDLMAQPGVA